MKIKNIVIVNHYKPCYKLINVRLLPQILIIGGTFNITKSKDLRFKVNT